MGRRSRWMSLSLVGRFLVCLAGLVVLVAGGNRKAACGWAAEGEYGGEWRQSDKTRVWAVLGDELAVESGFTDLLSVQLAGAEFQLVERAQLAELELELQRSLELGSVETAMEMGRRVGAQRLIVCQYRRDPNRAEDAPLSLRVFVCDIEMVARIATAHFEFTDLSECATNVTTWLKSANTFPKIDRVVGLAPFGCQNLGFDYLDIGRVAHDYLSEQILAIPGTALIEWQETRAMNREMDVTDAAGKRIVPWLFAVDYRVISEAEDAAPRVDVTLRWQSVGPSSEERETLGLVALDGWLRSRIVGKLLQEQARASGMSQPEQMAFLRDRAQTLFRLGAVQSTAQVREVILQIDPTDVSERLRLINDYGQVTKTLDRKRQLEVFPFTAIEIQARSFQRDHFEYLVRNRQISYEDALSRFPELAFDPDYKVAKWRLSPKYNLNPMELVRSQGALEADLQFVRQIAPAILRLNPNPAAATVEDLQRRVAWSRAVLSVASLNLWFNFGSEGSRIAAIRLITDVIPPDFPTIERGMWLFDFSSFPRQNLSTFDYDTMTGKRSEVGMWAEDLRDFYARYENASHRHVRLYMQLAIFNHLQATPMGLHDTFNSKQVRDHESITRLETQLEALQQEARQSTGAETRGVVPPNQDHLDFVLDRAVRYRRELDRQYKGVRRGEGGTAAPKFVGKPIPETEPELGRLKFDLLPLRVPKLDYDSTKWHADGPGHDLVSDKDRVYRLNAAGTFHPISPEKGYTFIDDDLVWLLERGESRTVKVSANDRNGVPVFHDEALELPPWIDFRGIGVGKGKVVIVGWFDGGTWCGLMERQGQKIGFRIFHEAREYLASEVPEEVERASKSVNTRFEARWLTKGSDVRGECVLVGRDRLTPIRIDLNRWHVTVMPLKDAHYQFESVIADQKLYQSKASFVYEWELSDTRNSIPTKRVIGVDHVKEVEQGNAAAGNWAGTLIVEGDWLIFPGWTWYRYNVKTSRVERLVKTRLPPEFQMGGTGASSLHGIVQWSFREDSEVGLVYRVTIAPDPSAGVGLLTFFTDPFGFMAGGSSDEGRSPQATGGPVGLMRQIGYPVTFVLVSLTLGFLSLVVLQYLRPRTRVVTRSVVLPGSPRRVFRVITTIDDHAWNSAVETVNVLSSTEGHEEWEEVSVHGQSQRLKATQKVASQFYEVEFRGRFNRTGRRSLRLEPQAPRETRLELTHTETDGSVVARVLGYFFSNLDETVDVYLRDLNKRLRRTVEGSS